MSSKGYKWYNNGIKQINSRECPEGYVPGMLRSSVEKSKETNKRLRDGGKVKKLSPEEREAVNDKISSTKMRWLIDIRDKYSYDDMFNLYITQNKTKEELTEILELNYNKVCKVIKSYNLIKPKALSYKRGIETKYREAGSKDEYDRLAYESMVKTLESKGITLDEHYSKISDKLRSTKYLLYGDPNYRDLKKVKDTCQERYGVDYPCQRIEARSHSANNSKPNNYFKSLLDFNNIKYEEEFSLGSYSYDFKIGDILVEINPTPTHNSTWGVFGRGPKEERYHFKKTKYSQDLGYRCINVWDWDDSGKIINIIKSELSEIVYGRKCEIREVKKEEAIEFINKHHLQGYAKDCIRIGLFYNGELVSIMTFDKPRYNKNYEYEIIRYCYSKNVIGGSEKLFKHFIDNYHPKSIISYCDNSKFSGGVYSKLGFTLDTYGQPSRHWYNIKTKKHITNNLLVKHGFDHLFGTSFGKGTSNEELMIENGFVEVYDAGQSRYIIRFD